MAWVVAARTAFPEPGSAVELMASGRDAEAVERLRDAVAIHPRDAAAYRLLGALLGERWERRALQTRATDFGVRSWAPLEPELRAEAVNPALQPFVVVQAVSSEVCLRRLRR